MFPKEHGRKASRCVCVISNLRMKGFPLCRSAFSGADPSGLAIGCRASLMVAALFLSSLFLWGQKSSHTLNEHKALYLFNFAKYTEWPPSAFTNESAPLVLAILGKDPFKSEIDIIKGKTIKGRKLVVKYCSTVGEVAGCHIVFICDSEMSHLSEILPKLDSGILTIAEGNGFIEQNGMINLVTEQKSAETQIVSFEINQEAAKRANLKLDTQLLKLAKRKKDS
jgi:hypothetical protein